MITVPSGARVLVATKPVDFRRGAESLAALAREELQRDPFSGVIIVFRSRRALHLLPLEACILNLVSCGARPPGRQVGPID